MTKPIDFDKCLFSAESEAVGSDGIRTSSADLEDVVRKAMSGSETVKGPLMQVQEGDYHQENQVDLTSDMFMDAAGRPMKHA